MDTVLSYLASTVLLPEKLDQMITEVPSNLVFDESMIVGSFSRDVLAQLCSASFDSTKSQTAPLSPGVPTTLGTCVSPAPLNHPKETAELCQTKKGFYDEKRERANGEKENI